MTADARARAVDAAFDRLLRDALGLPVVCTRSLRLEQRQETESTNPPALPVKNL